MEPGAVRERLVLCKLDAAGISLGLSKPAGNILDATFGLDHADTATFNKERIINRAAFSGPFGNCHGLSRLRSSPVRVAQLLAVHGPARRTQLIVDQDSGGGLIQLDLLGLLVSNKRQQIELTGRGRFGGGLRCSESGLGSPKSCFRLCGIFFPEFAILALGLSLKRGLEPCRFRLLVSKQRLGCLIGAGANLLSQIL